METILCALGKNVYSSVMGMKDLIECLLGPLVYSVHQVHCFFIFCLDVLSIIESGVLNSPTIIILLSISISVNISLIYLGPVMLGTYIIIKSFC